MNKEKNIQKPEAAPKKENVSVLERIRRKTGLLVGIVGLALAIFILESLLGSGASIFGGDDRAVGYINGKRVDAQEFTNKLEYYVANYRQNANGGEVNDVVRGQAVESVWQQFIVDYAIIPEFRKMGVEVGEYELYDRVVLNPVQYVIQRLSDRNGKIDPQFAAADGSFDRLKWKQAVQNVSGESELAVKQIEDEVKKTRLFEKFRMLLNKGIYVTRAEAKLLYESQNTSADIAYVMKRYEAVKDESVKLSDEEIQKYYNEHSYKYRANNTTRTIEYVAFNVSPSDVDMKEIESSALAAAEKLRQAKTQGEDSVVMGDESEEGQVMVQNMTRKNMTVRDSSIYTDAIGTVYGPYNEGAYFKVYKLQEVNKVADSARVRHILVSLNDPQSNQPKRSKAGAKREADSVLVLIKEKKASFDSLVINYSDDPGSKTNGGDYGWYDENENFVEPFKNAGLLGTKGNISVVETQFGYHIIEVLDVSKTSHPSYKVAQVFKPIKASEKTNQEAFAKASEFGGNNNTAEMFDKAVESQKLTKRVLDNIKDIDRQLMNIDNARELVKWVYQAKVGEITVYSTPDKHIVAKLTQIRNKGVLPLEIVKDEVAKDALRQKKADMLLEEFKSKTAGVTSVEAAAAKLGMESQEVQNLVLESRNVEGIGPEDILVGTASGLKAGTISKPVAGQFGVFIVGVKKITPPPADKPNYTDQQRQAEREVITRTDYEAFNAIKEAADIEDFKAKID